MDFGIEEFHFISIEVNDKPLIDYEVTDQEDCEE